MRRFFKRLRRGLKTACLAAALTTCWGIGQTAQAELQYGDEITMHFTGTVSPDTNDLYQVYLLYGTGSSDVYYGYWALKLGDFTVGGDNSFSVYGTANYHDSLFWAVAGLYGDLGGGVYEEGTNGVTLGTQVWEGLPWDEYWVPEADMFTYLLTDDEPQLCSNADNIGGLHWDSLETSSTYDLFDFSTASNNGQIYLESVIVPEPITVVMLGSGWLLVVASRRQKH
jgi:hypothetical protein